jgi:hypothetical protein
MPKSAASLVVLCLIFTSWSQVERDSPVKAMAWSKSGADQKSFMADRYDCAQQSQQTRSGAFVYGGVGSSNTYTVLSRSMFASCMGARGYVADPAGLLVAPPETQIRFTAQ